VQLTSQSTSARWLAFAALQRGASFFAAWLGGVLLTIVVGYCVYRWLGASVAILQLVYVVPSVLIADHRGRIGIGMGVLCGAGVVFALSALAAALKFLFGAEP
jgi:hypothetical protein